MHARVAADGPPPAALPVVLIHGLSVSGRYLLPTAARLAAARRTYVPDLPGFGWSMRPRQALSIRQLADVLAAWMDVMRLERVALLGHSFGCQILADLALSSPTRLSRVILVSPTIEPQSRTAVRQVGRLLRDALREPPGLLPIVLGDYYRAGLTRTIRTFRYALRDAVECKLPRVQVPSLVVCGSRDPLVPLRWAETAARLLPRGRLSVISGAAHAVPYSAPAALTRVVEVFLTEESRQAVATEHRREPTANGAM